MRGAGSASSRSKMAAVTALRSSCRTAGRLVRGAGDPAGGGAPGWPVRGCTTRGIIASAAVMAAS